MVAMGALLFTSCQKEKLEGQYMPDKKLSTVRSANIREIDGVETESMVLVANYNWDGKLLSNITTIYEKDNSGYSKSTFTYDSKKRVIQVTDETDYITVIKFFYNDKDMTKVDVYINSDVATDEYLFTKTDGKVTEITHIPLNSKDQKGNYNSLNYFLPVQIVKAMETASTVTEKGENNVTKLTWEGDNIVKIELVTSASTLGTLYTYDNKINPIKGLFGKSFYSTPESVFSANNILTSISEMPLLGTLTTTHTYEYDGDYPVKETVETKSLLTSSKSTVKYTYK